MSPVFDTVLVANRGEIACRVIRSARALGLRTVAVYADADAGAPHTSLADDVVRLGGTSPAESYLDIARVLDAAAATGAGAVHPGYGFLSESAGFARAVTDAGMVFVGPTPEQLETFGDKHIARAVAEKAGVPLVAGSGLLDDVHHAVRAAREIGYPVMLKATSGGGGIGLQPCGGEAELVAGFARVSRLVAANFGAGGVFLERFVANARHVEVQVFGDGTGTVVSLGDRDCSVQRRNQKVLEEAPAPGLPDAVRARMHRSARELCAAVSYRSAGTVEFVYDVDRQEASFLEVNARLQVEHPVTEEVSGVDLVAWMLRLARGDRDVLAGIAPDGPPSRDTRWRPGSTPRTRCASSGRAPGWSPGPSTGRGFGWTAGSRPDRRSPTRTTRCSPSSSLSVPTAPTLSPGWRRHSTRRGSMACRPTSGCCVRSAVTSGCSPRPTPPRRPLWMVRLGSRCCAAGP